MAGLLVWAAMTLVAASRGIRDRTPGSPLLCRAQNYDSGRAANMEGFEFRALARDDGEIPGVGKEMNHVKL